MRRCHHLPRVIHDVDESLRALVRRDALSGTDVDVVFDAPTKDWSSRRNAPAVDMYLYDLREDLRRRQSGIADVHVNGRVTARVQPPRWFKLSYLVTAWTQRPEDEHRILAALLRCFLMSDRLPPELLVGSLAGLPESVPFTCALPPPEDRALSDVWSALGGELKPSLDLVVYAPFDISREITIGPPVMEGVRLSMFDGEASDDRVGAVRPDPALDAVTPDDRQLADAAPPSATSSPSTRARPPAGPQPTGLRVRHQRPPGGSAR